MTNSHAEIVAFQLTVGKCSDEVFFCLDVTKLGHTTPHAVVPWTKSVRLITNATEADLKAVGISLRPAQLVFTH